MDEKPGARLPLVVKVAVALTFFNSWVLFEETVVDRQGLWQYMPFYRVGFFCAWDLLAVLVIVPGVWYALRRWRSHAPAQTKKRACFLKLRRCPLCS